MKAVLYLSQLMVPLIVFYIVSFGVLMKRPVYDDFVDGAREGIKTVVGIMPTLVGLMTAVGVLRSSGVLEAVSVWAGQWTGKFGVPSQIVPVALVRLFSSSAAVGLALDIFKEYGPDSQPGLTASLMLGCTETVFYTMSVYYLHVGVKKSGYTLAGALTASGVGVAASIILAKLCL